VSVSLQVCSRLSLVSLGYLWHQPQEQLLADMIDSGIHAVLVKVRQGWWALS
jgi:diphthine-ammonia ligase